MNYYVKERKFNDETAKTAWSKAREDAEQICRMEDFVEIPVWPDLGDRAHAGKLDKIRLNIAMGRIWSEALSVLKPGDTMLIQLPAINNCLFLGSILKHLRKKGVRIIALIHDLEILRMSIDRNMGTLSRIRINLEERNALRQCDKLIVHNDKMKAFLCETGIDCRNMVSLEIFDYLMDAETEQLLKQRNRKQNTLIVAGNLSPDKAGYVYRAPESAKLNLYGVFYEQTENNSLNYFGSFAPGQLPAKLEGGFGLIWDGPSAETCSGTYGEYLRYNNPHKTSLYLASGLPVVIWEEAAMVDFVQREGVGITAGSILEAAKKVVAVSDADYQQMCERAGRIGNKLRSGYYLRKAISG